MSAEPSISRHVTAFLAQLASNMVSRGEIKPFNMGLVVHRAVTMKNTIFWDVIS
jgi:hypothetical protein